MKPTCKYQLDERNKCVLEFGHTGSHHCAPTDSSSRTITLYRDDSTVQVVYENVKTFFWTANNTVLVISQYTIKPDHKYICWPRERFCWFKDEP